MAKLGEAVSDSATILPIFGYVNSAELPPSGVVQIESEQVRYTNTTDRELIGCTRGFGGTTAASHVRDTAVELLYQENTTPTSNAKIELTDLYESTSSHQSIAADLICASGVGSDSDPKYIAPIMGNIFGNLLSKTKPYLAGVIGAFSVTGAKSSTYPTGAVLAQVSDGVTDVDGAVVAYIDGDSAQTNAGAAFTVRNNNSVPGSGFAHGLDLKGASHDGYPAVSYTSSEIRFSNGIKVTVSGDTVVFTNEAGNKSFTITLV